MLSNLVRDRNNMKLISRGTVIVVMLLAVFSAPRSADAWYNHTLLTTPALEGTEELKNASPVRAETLRDFLIAEEKELEKLLAGQEAWCRKNLPDYAPRPESLAFRATGSTSDVVDRFLRAIRMNPGMRCPLFLQRLPGEKLRGRRFDPKKISVLKDPSFMNRIHYVAVRRGELLSPLHVLATASDEPDYGFDLGLFSDNKTPFGAVYGFGLQSFGNPNLDYGSQAPFHMGFYHEPWILYFFGPFLKKTYPEYRIHLFKELAVFAFQRGHIYWGWRFMGWGMHYLGDLSMPYHVTPLPGVSTLRMIWINLKAMIGFPESKNNAVQLVSNRHTVLEEYQEIIAREAYLSGSKDHPFFKALKNPVETVPYTDNFPREVASAEAYERADGIDEIIESYVPKKMVSDPSFEVSGSRELQNLLEVIRKEKGKKAIDVMNRSLAEIFRSYSMHCSSYMKAIRKESAASR